MKYWAICIDEAPKPCENDSVEFIFTGTAELLWDTWVCVHKGTPVAILGRDTALAMLYSDLSMSIDNPIRVFATSAITSVGKERITEAIERSAGLSVWFGIRDICLFLIELPAESCRWNGRVRVDNAFKSSRSKRERWMTLVNAMAGASCQGMATAMSDSNDILIVPFDESRFDEYEAIAKERFMK